MFFYCIYHFSLHHFTGPTDILSDQLDVPMYILVLKKINLYKFTTDTLLL